MLSLKHEQKMANLVVSRYKKLEKISLKDNKFFDENERIAYHDIVGHKILRLMRFLKKLERGDDINNINYKQLREEVSISMDEMVDKIISKI